MSDPETCGDYGGTNRDGEPCGAPAGRGTDFSDGKCKHHRGTNSDGSSHEGNTNAVTHGLFAETNRFYQDVLDDDVRALVDDIFSDYLEKYRELHGKPTAGDEAELFRIAVSYGKHVHAENWSVERPDELESGHPMVDRETHISESGREYYRYKETIVAKGQARLSRDRRAWVKDLGLLDDPQSQTADALKEGIDLTLSTDEKEGLDEAFDVDPPT